MKKLLKNTLLALLLINKNLMPLTYDCSDGIVKRRSMSEILKMCEDMYKIVVEERSTIKENNPELCIVVKIYKWDDLIISPEN